MVENENEDYFMNMKMIIMTVYSFIFLHWALGDAWGK